MNIERGQVPDHTQVDDVRKRQVFRVDPDNVPRMYFLDPLEHGGLSAAGAPDQKAASVSARLDRGVTSPLDKGLVQKRVSLGLLTPEIEVRLEPKRLFPPTAAHASQLPLRS